MSLQEIHGSTRTTPLKRSATYDAGDSHKALIELHENSDAFQKLRKAFEAVDVDGSGFIDIYEFGHFAGPILNISADSLESFFKEIDTDDSGKVSFNEFVEHTQQMSIRESETYFDGIRALSPLVSSNAVLESLRNKKSDKHAKDIARLKMLFSASLLIFCSAVVPLLMYWSQKDGKYEYNIPMFFLWRNIISSFFAGAAYSFLFKSSPFHAWKFKTLLYLIPIRLLLVISDIAAAFALEHISVDAMVGLKYSKMVFLCIFTVIYYQKIPRKDVTLTVFTFICLIIVYINIGSSDASDSFFGYVLVLVSAVCNVLTDFLNFIIFGKKLKSLHLFEGLCMSQFVSSVVTLLSMPFLSGVAAEEYEPFRNWNWKCWLLLTVSTIQCFSVFALIAISPEVKIVAKYLGKTFAIALSYAFFGGFEMVKFTLTVVFALNAFIYSMEVDGANHMKQMEDMISHFTNYDQALLELAEESPAILQAYVKYKNLGSAGKEESSV